MRIPMKSVVENLLIFDYRSLAMPSAMVLSSHNLVDVTRLLMYVA